MSTKSLFIFRRDLRIEDNTALNQALENNEDVLCIFIFDQAQRNHPYFSTNAFDFMIQSLSEVETEIHKHNAALNFLAGPLPQTLTKVLEEYKFEQLYLNKDYTPFAQKRDKKIKDWCQAQKITFKSYHDATLNAPEATKKEDGTPYKVFTPYYRNAAQIKVKEPETGNFKNLSAVKLKAAETLETLKKQVQPDENKKRLLKGGRKEALEIFKNLNKNYDKERDFPAQNGTTHLSAHHKFGTVSMRESFYALSQFYGPEHTVVSELYWHDFFTHVGYFFPHVFETSFTPKFENLEWENDTDKFKAWCEGKTGFPIVDAGMRELNQTGYMHNRVRMITASFLIKNLEINWQWGERYFAQNLIDYDPAINNGNWQWVASTGAVSEQSTRIYNPWSQTRKIDPKCEYIKEWVPELKGPLPINW
jgi:deoxyribodipyrimidine photo-lyase